MPLQVGDKTFYSVPEIAQKLNVTKVTIRNYLKQGKLQGQKTMGKWFISEEDLIDFFMIPIREKVIKRRLDMVTSIIAITTVRI